MITLQISFDSLAQAADFLAAQTGPRPIVSVDLPDAPAAPEPAAKPKPKRVRRTKAQIAADKAAADAAAAPEPAPEPAPVDVDPLGLEPAPEPAAPEVTHDMLAGRVTSYLETHGADKVPAVQAIFAGVGAKKLSEIEPENYATVYAALDS